MTEAVASSSNEESERLGSCCEYILVDMLGHFLGDSQFLTIGVEKFHDIDLRFNESFYGESYLYNLF